jgi:diaminohydroxyphosphoribosylaminopyrimidine deaminase/5-amino-6-(5-phosphoribosylamino)uracil reductase
MHRALEYAAQHNPHPNPRVGALVVGPDGSVLGAGAHRGPGSPHAEVVALEEAGDAGRGAALFVTLEPCVHHGRTPPCTEAIIAAGVARVFIGARDPDSRVDGKGIADLEEAGIEVTAGIAVDEIEEADPGYFTHRRRGRPHVTMKIAATLDGQAAARDGSSQWITGEAARADAHRLRANADAVMVGAGTVRRDDPLLTVRLPGFSRPQPRVVVVAGSGPLPDGARIWTRDPLVYRPGNAPRRGEIAVAGDGRAEPAAVLRDLAARGLLAVLLEGGPQLAGSFIRAGVVDRLVWYAGARVAAGQGLSAIAGDFPTLDAARHIQITSVRRIGADVRIDGHFEKE